MSAQIGKLVLFSEIDNNNCLGIITEYNPEALLTYKIEWFKRWGAEDFHKQPIYKNGWYSKLVVKSFVSNLLTYRRRHDI